MKVTPKLQTTSEALTKAIAASQHVDSVLASAQEDLASARSDHDVLVGELRQAEAKAALGEPQDSDIESLRDKVDAAQKTVASRAHQVVGLQEQVSARRVPLQRAGADYRAAFVPFSQATLAAERIEVRKAFEVARLAAAKWQTTAMALNDNSYFLVMSRCYLPDPENPDINLISPYTGQVPWDGNEELSNLYGSLRELSGVDAALDDRKPL